MKKKFIKVVPTFISFALLITISCSMVRATSITEFSDVPKEYWGYQTIMDMTKAGIFKGTTEPVNGVAIFSPEKEMTRAEFITASLRTIYPDETKSIKNGSTRWWDNYYVFAIQKGILKIKELDGGNLDKPMSREEMAMIMVRCVEKNGEKLENRIKSSQIPDYADIDSYYKDYVLDCFSFGLLCGIDVNGTFAPDRALTRAQAATVLYRLIDKEQRIDVEFTGGTVTDSDGDAPTDNDDSNTTIIPGGDTGPTEPPITLPWENGGKQPSEYSFAEFEALPDAYKDAFIQSFGTVDAFNKWKDEAQGTQNTEKLPWEDGGKQPFEYTVAEFEALPDAYKDAFIASFGSVDAFNKWKDEAQGTQDTEKLPWENGGKQPPEYTLAEFEALPDAYKDAFIQSFGSSEAFDSWMSRVQGTQNTEKLPWENGGKQPSEYTVAEFEALPDAYKDAFIASFGSTEAFDRWMREAQGTQNTEKLPWENGGKQPSEYTLAEFEALPDAYKDAFIQSFGSSEAFDSWMSRVQGTQNTEKLPWENGGKQPSEYTLAEFEALPDAYKDAFIQSFGGMDKFGEWLNANKP